VASNLIAESRRYGLSARMRGGACTLVWARDGKVLLSPVWFC
jgi:hypothetical protein